MRLGLSLAAALLIFAGAADCVAQAATQAATPTAGQPSGTQPSAPQAGAATNAPTQAAAGAAAGATSGTGTDAKAKQKQKNAEENPDGIEPGEQPSEHALRDERKAAKLYLQGVKLLAAHRSEAAMAVLQRAVDLNPVSMTYRRAAGLARESLVAQLDADANRAAAGGDTAMAADLLHRALRLDPSNDLTVRAIRQLGAGVETETEVRPQDASGEISGEIVQLHPSIARHSFHMRMTAPELIRQVYAAYGLTAEVHNSVTPRMVRLAIDDADFAQAAAALGLVTDTFYVPLDTYRVLVAEDTKANHLNLDRQQMETVYMPGMTAKELTDVSNMAHNVFGMKEAIAQPGAETVTVRASAQTLGAFNQTVAQLEDGRNQVDLNVKIIELEHQSVRETGSTFLQQTGVYNTYSEIQSILAANQSAVQQILSSGIISNINTLAGQIAIIGVLAASGALSGTPFNNGFIPFGNGLTQSLVTPGAATLTLSLNSSDTRTLNDVHLKLGDDEQSTIKDGEKYPIETASYSSATLSPAISAAATQAGYGALTQQQNVPQIEYEDLGLTFQARPRVMRSGDVALTLTLKIEALSGASLNGIPVLDSRQFDGVATLRAGETELLFSDLTRQEASAINGLPGISDIPGMQDINDTQVTQDVARLIVVITPNVTRSTQPAGSGPLLMVEKNSIQ